MHLPSTTQLVTILSVSGSSPLLQCMRTNVLEVFCGGDLATFPLTMAKDQRVNIGHWQMAQAHGNSPRPI